MFERYTEKARRIIFFARYEATLRGSNYIEPDHFLLGIIREDPGLICRLLLETTNYGDFFEQAEESVPHLAELSQRNIDIPLAHETKKIIVRAAEIAQNEIGPEHHLAAILERSEVIQAPLATILNQSGITQERVQQWFESRKVSYQKK